MVGIGQRRNGAVMMIDLDVKRGFSVNGDVTDASCS